MTTDLAEWEFRTDEPDWVNLPSGVSRHVGVVQDDGGEKVYYKALMEMDRGTHRWWVWEREGGRMQYGPEFPPEISEMLLAYLREQ
ncbi:hypothetical protein [Halolamina salifodinae]|uniref:Uncharacterized protein n=1 Tax=Halolamina salifodinae TaxID=1202767 RepID=A0A8T4GRX0_9EURY|nr:hypothetical protein [Halolamina salifodinae]MBP1985891.1 hypothetical protein [Halolamina salifodinae]